MTFRTRLLVGFIAVGIMPVIVGIIGSTSIVSQKNLAQRAFQSGTMGVVTANQMFKAFDTIKVALRDEALSADDAHNKAAADAYTAGVKMMEEAIGASPRHSMTTLTGKTMKPSRLHGRHMPNTRRK